MVTINEHEQYMEKALEQAQKAFDAGEVPVGAIIVNQKGMIISSNCNLVEREKTQTAHAELLVLKEAAQKKGDWRLDDCTLYVTLEPCSMCFSALVLSRLKTVVFGASSPLFGYSHEIDQFLKPVKIPVTVVNGIKQEKCSKLLQNFFELQRT